MAPPPAEAESRRLLAFTLVALLAVLFSVAAVFAWRLKLSALDAVYFVSTILTTVGFGDFNLRDADAGSKLVGILAMFAGLLLSTLLVGLVTNKLLSRQEQRRRGHYRQPLEGHVVVCGIGSMGLRIAEALRRLGESVVAVDPEPRAGRAALLRAAGVPLVEGDGSDERALLFANLPKARALVVATSRDHRNLEIALVARGLVPGLPVVLRLFDPDLCRRVASTFGIETVFSGTSLGAGLFTAFGDHGTRLASLHFGGQAYALHRLEATVHTSVGALRQLLPGSLVVAWDVGGQLQIGPAGSEPLPAGASLFVLVPEATRGSVSSSSLGAVSDGGL
jgi:Trk K+ transport system NAD-binding subunit